MARNGAYLRAVAVGDGLPDIPHMLAEIEDMKDVLMGRSESPISHGTISLLEVADAYYARVSEMIQFIQQGEREGHIVKGSAHYHLRTGELRTVQEMFKRAADLGSRRLTDLQIRSEMERTGRESKEAR